VIFSNSDTTTTGTISFWAYDATPGIGSYPQLIIEYTFLDYEDVASVNDNAPQIKLPDTLYGVVGDTLQLFIRGMVETQDPYAQSVIVESSIGNAFPRYYEVTPVIGDIGEKELEVSVLNTDYDTISSDTAKFFITADPDGKEVSPAINVGIFGDSITANGEWPDELYRRLATADAGDVTHPAGKSVTGVTFVGDKQIPSYVGQAFTGYAGWRFSDYNGTSNGSGYIITAGSHGKDKTDVATAWNDGASDWVIEYIIDADTLKISSQSDQTINPPTGAGTLTRSAEADIDFTASVVDEISPLWNAAFGGSGGIDWDYWTTRNSGGVDLDIAYVLLGWNSLSSRNQEDWSTYLIDVKFFLDTLHTQMTSTEVRIIGLQVPSPTGGIGANYLSDSQKGGQYYPMLRTVNNLNSTYQDLANETDYVDWVKFIGMMPQFDSEYNMPSANEYVNIRNTTTESLGTNAVHPKIEGSEQIADSVYREFIYTFLG
jgi:hypothetical protein